ncbi:hypothetical protein [uncultured Winogradskyella sp.]|uniref:hypothetical protein n=1 Tax=Winogradskyella sp. 4-2091 TaxID=3381659 RepID=UPI002620D695|nr:hypothetical protein [uncultured Winogradskyella sp.]
MNKIIIGTLLVFLMLSCQKKEAYNYIKNYYQDVYLAEEAYYKKDYKKVVEIMSTVENKCELINQSMIYEIEKYAESTAHIGKNEKTFELIRKLILKGYELDDFKTNAAFQNIINTTQWHDVEKEFDLLHTQYLNSINLELRKKVSEMTRIDQLYRQRGQYNQQKCDSIDTINEIELKQIIATYGYPDDKVIGGYKIDQKSVNPMILLFHFDDFDYWTKTLKELIKTGQAPPNSLGNFVDSYQRRVPEEKKFIYGIYDNSGEEDIIEFDKLDDRRISIGLPPMKLMKSIDSLKRRHYGF